MSFSDAMCQRQEEASPVIQASYVSCAEASSQLALEVRYGVSAGLRAPQPCYRVQPFDRWLEWSDNLRAHRKGSVGYRSGYASCLQLHWIQRRRLQELIAFPENRLLRPQDGLEYRREPLYRGSAASDQSMPARQDGFLPANHPAPCGWSFPESDSPTPARVAQLLRCCYRQ